MNTVMITGYIGNELELKEGGNGGTYMNFSVYVPTGRKDERIPVPCTAFGKTAEYIEMYFAKGKAIEITGAISYSSWTDKESGKKKSSIGVVARSVGFPPHNKEMILGQGQQRQGVNPKTAEENVSSNETELNQNDFFAPEGFEQTDNGADIPW